MAEDLRFYLAAQIDDSASHGGGHRSAHCRPPSRLLSVSSQPTLSLGSQVKIVPKGLRSFDAHDADFFLELLPGPRDRDGLPESLRFWKTRIEETDPDKTFAGGLIYGPSGCGKSSLVKAGLLPRLADDILRLHRGHGRRDRGPACRRAAGSAVPTCLRTWVCGTAWLPCAGARPAGGQEGADRPRPVRAVAARPPRGGEHRAGRRLCGSATAGASSASCMVRDDFWMAATRFMGELEIRLLEGHNSAAVDLFDPTHARRVLASFGRAFGRLPEATRTGRGQDHTYKDQVNFLKEAVAGLAQEGKVICVRLALFAEMMKGKPWTRATLSAVGGTQGVGFTFLEENFSAGRRHRSIAITSRPPAAFSKPCCPNRARTSRGTCDRTPICSRRPAMRAAARISTT